MSKEKYKLGTKSQSVKAKNFLNLAFNLLPNRPSPIDAMDILVGLKLAQYMWKEVLKEEQISIDDETLIDSLIKENLDIKNNDINHE